MRSLRVRRQVALPVPRPFRLTRCTASTRPELARVLALVDAAYGLRRDADATTGMSVVFDKLCAVEPEAVALSEEMAAALSIGAAFFRLQSGEAAAPGVRMGKTRTKEIDADLWNALSWAGVELGCRFPSAISALADYGVRVGHYLAFHGLNGVRAVETELHEWLDESGGARGGTVLEALVDGQLVAKFWLDARGGVCGRSALPLRPSRSVEKLYDDLLFDLAWDDLHERLGQGRPRKTVALSRLAPVDWEPSVEQVLQARATIDLRPPAPAESKRPHRVAEAAPGPLSDAPRVNGHGGEPPLKGVFSADDASQRWPIPLNGTAVNGVNPAAVNGAAINGATANGSANGAVSVNGWKVAFAETTRDQPRAPAGWYADPHHEHDVRWWDGTRWTAAVADRDAPVPACAAHA